MDKGERSSMRSSLGLFGSHLPDAELEPRQAVSFSSILLDVCLGANVQRHPSYPAQFDRPRRRRPLLRARCFQHATRACRCCPPLRARRFQHAASSTPPALALGPTVRPPAARNASPKKRRMLEVLITFPIGHYEELPRCPQCGKRVCGGLT